MEMLFVLSLKLCETMKNKDVPICGYLSSTKGPSEVHFYGLTLCTVQVKQKVELANYYTLGVAVGFPLFRKYVLKHTVLDICPL